jgi:hypothetical protein
MKKSLILFMGSLLVMLIFAPVAFAQETTVVLPPTGSSVTGSVILLPGAALLVGAGVLTYAILRRR